MTKKNANTDFGLGTRKKDYQKIRRGRIEKLANSEESNANKIKKLEFESSKLEFEFRKKEELLKYKTNDVVIQQDAVQILLSGIQAKMGIINAIRDEQEEENHEWFCVPYIMVQMAHSLSE